MKLSGLSDKAISRIAASQRSGMAFMAEPPVKETYKGIIEYPGFHTTTSFDIAAAYAVGRVMNSFDETDDGVHHVTDYPVVVKLDMTELERNTDYDAEQMVWEVLREHLADLAKDIDEDSDDFDIIDKARNIIDFSESSSELSQEPLGFISEQTFGHFNNPLVLIIDDPGFPDAVRKWEETGEFSQDLLMKATDQFRYTQDVSEMRLLEVHYITPVAGEAETPEHEDDEEAKDELYRKWEGFDIPWEDDLMGSTYNFSHELVWEDKSEQRPEYQDSPQLSLPGIPPSLREEYHGTTYKRLLSAAPGIGRELPAPPSPPYKESGE